MRLENEFIRLPYLFDAERLQYELAQFKESDWLPHPNHLTGNMSIPLISAGGGINDDMFGEMMMTECLKKSPYLQQIISTFGQVFGRSRLMRLEPSCTVPEHCDMHYHWFSRVRIHIPIVTNQQVIFHCADKKVHMAEGESWLFDSWKMHRVSNDSNRTRVHLVLDTAGDSQFWQMVAKSEYLPGGKKASVETQKIAYEAEAQSDILMEKFNTALVMSPGEVDFLAQDLIEDAKSCQQNDPVKLAAFVSRVDGFQKDWRKYWSLYADQPQYINHYTDLVHRASRQDEQVRLGSIETSAERVFQTRILAVALNPTAVSAHTNRLSGSDSIASVKEPTKGDVKKPLSDPKGIFKPQSKNSISRNAPCHCRSGIKYKQCCGKI